MTSPYLSLILPAYNEVKSIVRTLTEVRAYLARQTYSYEILVCADGNDGTREAAREFFAGSPLGRVLGSAERRGKGCGVREGVLAASGQIIGFTDADNKTPISEIEKVWDGFNQGCDVVIGSRGMSQSKIERHQPLYRRWGSKTFRLVMHMLTGLWTITDTQCGFKFFQRDAALDLFSRQKLDGYMFDVEILYLAQRLGYRLHQVGVRWRDDGDSRLQLLSGNIRNGLDLLRFRMMADLRPKAVRETTQKKLRKAA